MANGKHVSRQKSQGVMKNQNIDKCLKCQISLEAKTLGAIKELNYVKRLKWQKIP